MDAFTKRNVPCIVVAIVVACAQLAIAAAVRADNVIVGCVGHRGKLRLVDSASACRQNESPIQWNDKGPPGPAGPAGDPGAPGTAGSTLARTFSATGPFTLDGTRPQQFPSPSVCFEAADPSTCGYVPLGSVILSGGDVWAVNAKVWLEGTHCADDWTAECRLVASDSGDTDTPQFDSDHAVTLMVSEKNCAPGDLNPSNYAYSSTPKSPLSLQLMHWISTPSDLAVLYCRNNNFPGNPIRAHDVIITALKVTMEPAPTDRALSCGLTYPTCDGDCPPNHPCMLGPNGLCECSSGAVQ